MKKRLFTCVVVCLALAVLPVVAAPKVLRLVRLEGWIVDENCGAKNANAAAKEDTLECHKKGADLVFVSNKGDVYHMDKQEQSVEYVGEEIRIFGSVDEDDLLRVGQFVRLKKDEEAAEAKPADDTN